MWQRINQPFGSVNYVLMGDGFYVSYNALPWASPLGALFASDDLSDETALCYNGRFDVLNGDFREAYESLVPAGIAAYRQFYQQQAAHANSSWTTESDQETPPDESTLHVDREASGRR